MTRLLDLQPSFQMVLYAFILAITHMDPYLILAPDFLVPKKYGPREIWSPRNLIPKKFGPKEVWAMHEKAM